MVEGLIGQARVGLAAAEQARRTAAERQTVADRQLAAAGRPGSSEIGAFDLFRVRQLQIEAVAVAARALDAGRARSRLNQALGVVPGGAPGG